MKKKMLVPLVLLITVMLALPNLVSAPPPPPAPQTPIYRYVGTAAFSTGGWLPVPSPTPIIENLEIYIDAVAAIDLYIYNTLTAGVYWADLALAAWFDAGVRFDHVPSGAWVEAVASVSAYVFGTGTFTMPVPPIPLPQDFVLSLLVGFILEITISGVTYEIFFAAIATARWVGGVFVGVVSSTIGTFPEFIQQEIRFLQADLWACPDIPNKWLTEVKLRAALDYMNRAINCLAIGDEWHAWAYMRRARLKLMEFESLIIQHYWYGRIPGDIAYKMYKISEHLIWHLEVATT